VRGPSRLIGLADSASDAGVLVSAIHDALEERGAMTAEELRAELKARFGFRGATATVQRHAERGVEHGELRMVAGRFEVAEPLSVVEHSRPAFVDTVKQLREEIERFQSETVRNRVRAWSIVRATVYWVFDSATEQFAPIRLAAYRDMDFEAYASSRQSGSYRGERFDEHTAKEHLESVLDLKALPDNAKENRVEQLVEWADEFIEADVLADLDTHWRFVTID
jgi:hypothetical protein